MLAFHICQSAEWPIRLASLRSGRGQRRFNMVSSNDTTPSGEGGPCQDVLQLSHIARPIVLPQREQPVPRENRS